MHGPDEYAGLLLLWSGWLVYAARCCNLLGNERRTQLEQGAKMAAAEHREPRGADYRFAKQAVIGLVVACAFLVGYVFLVGVVTYLNVVVLGLFDEKFYNSRLQYLYHYAPWQAWLKIDWPFCVVLYAPSAVAALIAAWYSKLSLWDAALLLSAFLTLLLTVMQVASPMPAYIGGLVFTVIAFFVTAQICRSRTLR